MSAILQLVGANARHHRGRLALAALAIAAASTSVVWVVSGYEAMASHFDAFSEGALGRYDLVATPRPPAHAVPGAAEQPSLSPEAISALRGDAEVSEVAPMTQIQPIVDMAVHVSRVGPAEQPASAPTPAAPAPLPAGAKAQHVVPLEAAFASPQLVGTGAEEPPYTLLRGRWLGAPGALEGVLTQPGAETLGAAVGDTLRISAPTGVLDVELVGIARGPEVDSSPGQGARGPAKSAVYLRPTLLEQIIGRPAPPTLALLDLREGVELAAFRARWEERLGQLEPPVILGSLADVAENREQGWAANAVRAQAYSATAMALLAALFIIFTTCSMGVSEGQRELAMMRAIGLSRLQLARLVLSEALGLGLFGWLGGLAAGWGLLSLVNAARPGAVELGPRTALLSAIAAFGGALLAALIPAFRATRIDPLEGMAARAAAPRRGWLWVAGPLGLALASLGPLILSVAPLPPAARPKVFALVGVPSLGLGLLCLTPALVVVAERLLGGLVARSLRVEPGLLASQLSSNLGRTVGTTLALSVGLALFVAMQAWGYSMLQPFLPGEWAPDAIVSFMSGGLSDEEAAAVRGAEGLVEARTFPLAVEQLVLADDLLGHAGGSTIVEQDNVILAGIDPAAFEGEDPAMHLSLLEGTPAAVAAALRSGRACVVPAHFARKAQLKLGDSFSLVPLQPGAPPVSYQIAGISELQGWHWMTKFSGFRRRRVRAGALVFAGFQQVRRDFDLEQINYFWAHLEPGASGETLAESLLPIAERNLGELVPVNGQGTLGGEFALTAGNSLRITTPGRITGAIGGVADRVIRGMSLLPLVTLLISGLAILNTMLASVRARRWEIGVLRALGVSRGMIARLVLAESLLVALAACLLGLGAGLLAGWCGAGVANIGGTFGGLKLHLVLPWRYVLPALGLTLALCGAAGLWPAARAGLSDPLDLLQGGRGGARG